MLSKFSFSVLTAVNLSAAVGIAVMGIALPAPGANAGTISGTMAAAPSSSAGSPIDISTGASDWIYYGVSASGTYSPITPSTMSGGPNSFSALTGKGLVDGYGSPVTYAAGNNFLSFSGGTTVSSETSNTYTFSAWTPSGFSFTQSLLGPSETMNVYLNAYNADQGIAVSLSSGGTYTYNGALPQGAGAAGVLTMNIAGSPGDTLTFTDTGTSTGSNGNIGIQAVTVTAVPEPGVIGLLAAVGSLALLASRRVLRRVV